MRLFVRDGEQSIQPDGEHQRKETARSAGGGGTAGLCSQRGGALARPAALQYGGRAPLHRREPRPPSRAVCRDLKPLPRRNGEAQFRDRAHLREGRDVGRTLPRPLPRAAAGRRLLPVLQLRYRGGARAHRRQHPARRLRVALRGEAIHREQELRGGQTAHGTSHRKRPPRHRLYRGDGYPHHARPHRGIPGSARGTRHLLR